MKIPSNNTEKMRPKKNTTTVGPAKNTIETRAKKKETITIKYKIPSVIKCKIPATKCLQRQSSQSILATPDGAEQLAKVAVNEENPDSQSNLTSLKTKSMPAKVTNALKRKHNTETHELASTGYTEPEIVNPAASKANSPRKVAKVNKRKTAEILEVNPVPESPISPLKVKITPTRVVKLRGKKMDTEAHAANDITNGGIPDSQTVSPPTSGIKKPRLTKTKKAPHASKPGSQIVPPPTSEMKKPKLTRMKAQHADEYKCNMCPPLTAVVPVKMTKAEKRAYGSRERKIELANEVSLDQLGIKPALIEAPPPIKKVSVRKSPVKPRKGRRPKDQEAEDQPSTTGPAEESIKTNPKRKTPKKTLAAKKDKIKVNETMSNATSKMKADSTSKKKKKPLYPKPKQKYTRRKGKAANDIPSIDHIESPSILEASRSGVIDTIDGPRNAAVISRKTSFASASDCLSWTKDISDSSTTTCVTVCSKDFVRIDKKLPVLKLLKCNNIQKSKPVAAVSDFDTTHDETTKCTSNFLSDTNSDSHSLNLSKSTAPDASPDKSHTSSAQEVCNENVGSTIDYALDKINSQLMKIDIEIMNWLGPEDENTNINVKQLQDNVLKILKEENELIMQCREIKQIFGEVDNGDMNYNNEIVCDKFVSEEKMDFSDTVCNGKSDSSELEEGEITSDSSESESDSDEDEHNLMPPPPIAAENSRVDEASRRLEEIFIQSDNDDDALSLFAESITGLESLRADTSPVRTMCESPGIRGDERYSVEKYVSKPSQPQMVEAYIPQPVNEPLYPTPKITYCPTKIVMDSEQGAKASTVCEKQNADSTSIYRETKHIREPVATVNFENKPTTGFSSAVRPATDNKDPILIADVVPQITTHQTSIFRGVCFYNLISTCRNINCRYPHAQIPVHEIQRRLYRLSDQKFMQEYLLLRSWPNLRRLYRRCFVEHCQHRGLARLLVEMAIDSIKIENKGTAEELTFEVYVIEATLLNLNEHFHECHDLLTYKVRAKPLCIILMEAIAGTPNFSRFKPIFVNLTFFIALNVGSFTLSVANHILERVCILPFEVPLAQALLTIVRHTDKRILGNPMLVQFEKQLSCAHRDLHNEFIAYKQQALVNQPDLAAGVPPDRAVCPPPAVQSDQAQCTSSVVQSERERYTSPDTTKLDNTNKVVCEPVVMRTMDGVMPPPQPSFNSSMSSYNTDFRPPVKSKFRSWGPRTYNNANSPGVRCQRPILRPLMVGSRIMRPTRPYLMQRLVTDRPPPKFPRMPGPNNMSM